MSSEEDKLKRILKFNPFVFKSVHVVKRRYYYGKELKVTHCCALESAFIFNLFEAEIDVYEIKIKSKILSDVLDFCEKRGNMRILFDGKVPERELEKLHSHIRRKNLRLLIGYLHAACRLQIKSLLDLTSTAILCLIDGKDTHEILKIFNLKKGLTLEDIEAFRNAYGWAFETRGGLIQLNHGRPQPLQYVVNAAFLATLYSDYLDAADTPGWYCGPNFYSTNELRKFAETQIDYILGKNPRKMSYVVGYGDHYPKHVHHRGASIPKNKVKYNCKGGYKWRDSKKPNPHIITGAMVAGPDRRDGFHDVRTNYNYTEPTLAGNAGLVAALVALSGDRTAKIDKNTIFSAVPPMFPTPPPPPAPWKP